MWCEPLTRAAADPCSARIQGTAAGFDKIAHRMVKLVNPGMGAHVNAVIRPETVSPGGVSSSVSHTKTHPSVGRTFVIHGDRIKGAEQRAWFGGGVAEAESDESEDEGGDDSLSNSMPVSVVVLLRDETDSGIVLCRVSVLRMPLRMLWLRGRHKVGRDKG